MARMISSCIVKASNTIKNERDMLANEFGETLACIVDELTLAEFKIKMKEAGRRGEFDDMSYDEYDDFAADMRADIRAQIRGTVDGILWVLNFHPEYIYVIESLLTKLEEEESFEKK